MLLQKYFVIQKVIIWFQLDYCASLKNLQRIKDKPNYKFIQVGISHDLFSHTFLLQHLHHHHRVVRVDCCAAP